MEKSYRKVARKFKLLKNTLGKNFFALGYEQSWLRLVKSSFWQWKVSKVKLRRLGQPKARHFTATTYVKSQELLYNNIFYETGG